MLSTRIHIVLDGGKKNALEKFNVCIINKTAAAEFPEMMYSNGKVMPLWIGQDFSIQNMNRNRQVTPSIVDIWCVGITCA